MGGSAGCAGARTGLLLEPGFRKWTTPLRLQHKHLALFASPGAKMQ
jgi:hypothetical protein